MNIRTAKAVGPVKAPVPALSFEVECPDLSYDWESIEAESGADAALRWARKRGLRREMELYSLSSGLPVHVRASRLDAIYRVIYEEGPVYIAELA
jgi:hypothetical protein